MGSSLGGPDQNQGTKRLSHPIAEAQKSGESRGTEAWTPAGPQGGGCPQGSSAPAGQPLPMAPGACTERFLQIVLSIDLVEVNNTQMSFNGVERSKVEQGGPPRRATRFLGTSQHPVDDKGRVFFPKRFLPELPKDSCGDARAMVMLGPGGCLFAVSEVDFDLAQASVPKGVFPSDEDLRVQQSFFRNLEEVQLKSGRLLLPERLRSRAGIGAEVVMVGCGNRVEIWDPERLAASEASVDGAFMEQRGVSPAPDLGGGA